MKRLILTLLVVVAVAAGLVAWLGTRNDAPVAATPVPADKAAWIARGEYLVRAGDCVACHTARGGMPYAGGRAIRTGFGTFYGPNITPDKDTGIGDWSADDFWHALHDGKGKNGTLLYPAFPFPNYTRVSRADADAMFAYLQSLPPVRQASRKPELQFPFDQRILLAGWRALYFRPGVFEPQPGQNAEWNRGAYLVQGLGHCNACHTPRNILGATQAKADLSGAMIPMLDWYASPLTGEKDAGLGAWKVEEVADLLKTGVSMKGAVSGPMAEVVRESLQHLSGEDVRAMAVYLKSLPQHPSEEKAPSPGPEHEAQLALGASLYEKHCVDCHGANGQGEGPHYPPLAGNRAVTLSSPTNVIRMVLHGGYPPSTGGNPRPYGMPPFSAMLSDEEVAAVVSSIRNAWGNRASLVQSGQVNRYRAVVVD
ncbi:cytochrome c [Noviherbaspirillum galbum]|uniref:C-type cytochrome n=1 Tax=Noviherbaspirillum galbum TaxID=2709383 RepID=A0A6B3SPT8_9BURK|nr:cytochrome c [Noviherbaspirillum galbum]NEX62920.1 c-type cytochrome [Noviherbaspirillum galbum]